MQNSNWGNKNKKIEKNKDKDKDDYKPDPRMVRVFKNLEKMEEKMRREKLQNWLK